MTELELLNELKDFKEAWQKGIESIKRFNEL